MPERGLVEPGSGKRFVRYDANGRFTSDQTEGTDRSVATVGQRRT